MMEPHDTAEVRFKEGEDRGLAAIYHKMLSTVPDIVIRTDMDGSIVFINDQSPSFSKYFSPADHPLGRNVFSLIAPHDRKRAADNVSLMMKRPMGVQAYDIILDDGRQVSCDVNGSVMTDDQGRPVGLMFIVRDITEKRKTEAALAQSEKKFRSMADMLPQTVFEAGLDGTLTYVNRNAYEDFGYAAEDFRKGLNIFSMLAPEDRTLAGERVRAMLKGRAFKGNEYKALRKDGSTFPVVIYSSVIEEEGRPVGLRGILIDLSDIRRAEDERVINESKFRAIYDQAGHAAGIINAEGILLETNQTARRLIRADESAFIGRLFWETPWWDNSPKARELVKAGIQKGLEGDFVRFETGYVNHKKEQRQIDFSIKPVLNLSGNVFCLILEGRDITEQKQAERIMRLVQYGVNHSRDGIFWLDSETRLVYVNDAACRSLGYSREELMTMTISDIDPDFPLEAWEPHLEKLRELGSLTRESRHRARDGRIFPVEVTGNYVVYEGREGSFAFARDITDRKQAEEERRKLEAQLIQAQKMDSIGRLAGGVAHDFNNMLGAIMGYVELGLRHPSVSFEFQGYLKQIRSAAGRAADLTRQLLAFARKQAIAPRVLDLNRTVAGMLSMIKRLIGENIDLDWQPDQDLCTVYLDPSQVDQILMNLCINARDAIADMGRIVIRTGNEMLTEDDLRHDPTCRPGRHVLLEVRDTGSGMDAESLSHLFEPFYTTKESGKGTGLGLATVYGIVQQNNGLIKVDSKPGKGTTFRIFLPCHDETKTVPLPPDEAFLPESGHETILVVEDEPMILEMTREMLEFHGYTVLSAERPGEALHMVDEYEGAIHLLLTDLVMPEMNGWDLAEKLRNLRPDIKCLFMSGYSSSVIARRGILDETVNFIQKPFSIQELTTRVRHVLGSGDGPVEKQ